MNDNENEAVRSPRRRLYWVAAVAAAASLVTVWRSLHDTWATFAFAGEVAPRMGQPSVTVNAFETLDAAAVAAATGVDWFGQPRSLVIVVVALVVVAVGVALRLWVLPAVMVGFGIPAAWSQQTAIEAMLLAGPGGEYVTAGPGLTATGLAMGLAFVAAATCTVQVFVLRRAEVREARLAAERAGEEPPVTVRDLFGQMVASRIGVRGGAALEARERQSR